MGYLPGVPTRRPIPLPPDKHAIPVNAASPVLLVPLAVNLALGVGANPAVFALTVAIATSNVFILPTHQVNALIMGPAGHKVADFIRAGGIMTLQFILVLMLGLFYT